MANDNYNEDTLQEWVAVYVTNETDIKSINQTQMRELRQRYYEEIAAIPAQDALIRALGPNQAYTKEQADVVETRNAIRYYMGLPC